MKIQILAVGARTPDWVETQCQEYLQRLPRDWQVSFRLVKHEANGDAERIQLREAERLRKLIEPGALLASLDEHGERMTSNQLATWLQKQQQPIQLLIGGSLGLDESLKASCKKSLRLSDLTLPHMLVRVLLAEQLYRAWSILSGHPYHHA